MESDAVGMKEFGRVIVHAVLVSILLAVWLITAWATDQVLLARFPLEGMSIVSFRLLEFTLHLSTFRFIYRQVLRRRKRNIERWWV